MNIIQKSIAGITPHILRLKKLLAGVLAHREGIAFDISLRGHDRNELLRQCREAGFGSFGKYKTFLHVDTRRNRRWGSWD